MNGFEHYENQLKSIETRGNFYLYVLLYQDFSFVGEVKYQCTFIDWKFSKSQKF